MRLNVGCASQVTPGWINVDSSPSVWLASHLSFARLLRVLGLIKETQWAVLEAGRKYQIVWGNAAKKLPFGNGAADIIYSCHMLEHLDNAEVSACLKEFHRVLQPGGILRLVLPDLRTHVNLYLKSNDADAFMAGTLLGRVKPRTLVERLRSATIGDRSAHCWMYDGPSLIERLEKAGFVNGRCLPPGATGIENPGALDLFERAAESFYVEANKPTARLDNNRVDVA